jgi:hypothetical protein
MIDRLLAPDHQSPYAWHFVLPLSLSFLQVGKIALSWAIPRIFVKHNLPVPFIFKHQKPTQHIFYNRQRLIGITRCKQEKEGEDSRWLQPRYVG